MRRGPWRPGSYQTHAAVGNRAADLSGTQHRDRAIGRRSARDPNVPNQSMLLLGGRPSKNGLPVKNQAPLVLNRGILSPDPARTGASAQGVAHMPRQKCNQCGTVKRCSMYVDNSSTAVTPFSVYLCRACAKDLGFHPGKAARPSSGVSSKKSR